MRKHVDKNQRGDTLIEVMLAIAITAIVVVLTITLMNRGTASIRSSIERSQVRSAMQGQVDLLLFMRGYYMADDAVGGFKDKWTNILTNYITTDPLKPGSISDKSGCSPGASTVLPFYLEVSATGLNLAGYSTGSAPEAMAKPGQGMWIEAYRVNGSNSAPNAIDFAVRACWVPFGGGSIQHETTIVRLYDGN